MLEADLREAIRDANDLGHFFLLMEHRGYEIRHGGRLGFRLRGQERFQYPGQAGCPLFAKTGSEQPSRATWDEIEAGRRPVGDLSGPAYHALPEASQDTQRLPGPLCPLSLPAGQDRAAAVPAPRDAALCGRRSCSFDPVSGAAFAFLRDKSTSRRRQSMSGIRSNAQRKRWPDRRSSDRSSQCAEKEDASRSTRRLADAEALGTHQGSSTRQASHRHGSRSFCAATWQPWKQLERQRRAAGAQLRNRKGGPV